MYDRKLSLKWALLATVAGAVIGSVVNVVAQSPGVNSPFNPVWSIPLDSIKRTYSLQVNNLSPAGQPTDIMQLCGAAGITTKLTRVLISGRATAVASSDILLVKRSGFAVGGTAYVGGPINGTSQVGIPYDANDAAGQSNVIAYTSNPTVGTFVGTLAAIQATWGNLTTGVPGPVTVLDFGNRPSKAPTLRSATQCLAVNLSGANLGGGNLMDITMEWTEE